jgi:hypothetical protein
VSRRDRTPLRGLHVQLQCAALGSHELVPLWTVVDTRGLHDLAPAEIEARLIFPERPGGTGRRRERGTLQTSVDPDGRWSGSLSCPACPRSARRPYPLTSRALVHVLDAHYQELERAGKPVSAGGMLRLDLSQWRQALEALC